MDKSCSRRVRPKNAIVLPQDDHFDSMLDVELEKYYQCFISSDDTSDSKDEQEDPFDSELFVCELEKYHKCFISPESESGKGNNADDVTYCKTTPSIKPSSEIDEVLPEINFSGSEFVDELEKYFPCFIFLESGSEKGSKGEIGQPP